MTATRSETHLSRDIADVEVVRGVGINGRQVEGRPTPHLEPTVLIVHRRLDLSYRFPLRVRLLKQRQLVTLPAPQLGGEHVHVRRYRSGDECPAEGEAGAVQQ